MRTILAIDQGTTNTKALLVDKNGQVLARASRPVQISYPHPAWVEQDSWMLWNTTRECIIELVDGLSEQQRSSITAVAVTNQRETVLVWYRKTGEPAGPAIIWQCRRTSPFCDGLRSRGLDGRITRLTGLTIDPMPSGSKARWLLDSIPDGHKRAVTGELAIGTVDSWILWNLTGGKVHATDTSNASRTQLFNLETAAWDPELLDLFGIPAAALPEIKHSSALYGETVPLGKLPGGIPITSLVGDSHAALFGHAGFEPGMVKATYGTGTSLMSPTLQPVFSSRGISTTVAYSRERVRYALEGNILVTGSAVQWFGQLFGLQDTGKKIEELATSVDSTDGVYLVPAFVGLGAPHWKDRARGNISGLTRGSSMAHIARATLEAIAYEVRDVFDAMESDSGAPLLKLLADGGASQNAFLMQFQADILGRPVQRNLSSDIAPVGAAYLAGLEVGIWKDEAEIASLPRQVDLFEPKMDDSTRIGLYSGWKDAVARTVYQP